MPCNLEGAGGKEGGIPRTGRQARGLTVQCVPRKASATAEPRCISARGASPAYAARVRKSGDAAEVRRRGRSLIWRYMEVSGPECGADEIVGCQGRGRIIDQGGGAAVICFHVEACLPPPPPQGA